MESSLHAPFLQCREANREGLYGMYVTILGAFGTEFALALKVQTPVLIWKNLKNQNNLDLCKKLLPELRSI